MKTLLPLLMLLAVTAAVADDDPLRVYAFGAPGAAVYVAPVGVTGPTEASSSDIGPGAFQRKYFRGQVPLATPLRPGQYLVSVVQTTETSMRDGMMDAHEMTWDGFDYHALVGQENGRWRYAHCYLVDKVAGFPLEVLAVFTNQMSDDNVLSFDCGSRATRYSGKDEDAAGTLTAGGIAMTFHDDIIRGLRAGHKVILRSGEARYAVQCEGPANLRITTAQGLGAWAGHRLSMVSFD